MGGSSSKTPQPSRPSSPASQNARSTPSPTNSASLSSASQNASSAPSPSMNTASVRSSDVSPPVPVEVPRHVVFDANDYKIPINAEINNPTYLPPYISNNFCDRKEMRICPQYNSKYSCHIAPCHRFHVCLQWIIKNCEKDDCNKDHHFSSPHNNALYIPYSSRKFNHDDVKLSLLKNYEFFKRKRIHHSENICMDYILKRCNRKDCASIHFPISHSWQVENNSCNIWYQVTKDLNAEFESKFCDPNNGSHKVSQKLTLINCKHFEMKKDLSLSKEFTIDFNNMTLQTDFKTYNLRRLGTPSDIFVCKNVATRWIWYWEDDDGSFKPYINGKVDKFFHVSLSDYIERVFHDSSNEMDININNTMYKIDFENRIQINQHNQRIRNIRRRPRLEYKPAKQPVQLTFPTAWSDLKNDKGFVRLTVSRNSDEFLYIESMILKDLSCTIDKIERVENSFMWKAYQIKKDQMKSCYNHDMTKINEQYMFHGTSPDVIDAICSENLDWRLYGTKSGHVFGKGTYFSNNARYSDSYTVRDNNQKTMFVALVLVGLTTVGTSSMEIPPKNEATGALFDTTVNGTSPCIFVKYNLDEYYPAYIIYYK